MRRDFVSFEFFVHAASIGIADAVSTNEEIFTRLTEDFGIPSDQYKLLLASESQINFKIAQTEPISRRCHFRLFCCTSSSGPAAGTVVVLGHPRLVGVPRGHEKLEGSVGFQMSPIILMKHAV